MKIVAAILCAGKGTRFGSDKTQVPLRGRPVWRYSYDTFSSHPGVTAVGIVCSAEAQHLFQIDSAAFVVAGGATRQQSAFEAVKAAGDADVVLLHDGARPFVTQELISRVIASIEVNGAAAPGVQVTDTIRERSSLQTLDRSALVAMQTPQGAKTELLRAAFEQSTGDFTDELALLTAAGIGCDIVDGDPNNFKITTAEDHARASAVLGPPETRTGIGYDVHAFDRDPSSDRTLMLGGIAFPGERPLEGHSDADVLLHAITDSILGAAGLGDIGQHFPNTDPRWLGKESIFFLRAAKGLIQTHSWRILNIDATVIAEFPKVMKKAEAIRRTVSEALGIEERRVSIKATTNERLGSIGRGEGIAAFAVANLVELT